MPLTSRGASEFEHWAVDPDHLRIEPVRSHRRAWLLAIASLAILIALAVVAYRYAPAIGTPSPTALNYSVARELGAGLSWTHACERRSGQTWRCAVFYAKFSGTGLYVVTMDGRRCWHARAVGSSDSVSGCVMLSDQLRLSSRI